MENQGKPQNHITQSPEELLATQQRIRQKLALMREQQRQKMIAQGLMP